MDTKVAFRVLACGLLLVALLRFALRDAEPVTTLGDGGASRAVEADVEPSLSLTDAGPDDPAVPSTREERADLEPEVEAAQSPDGLARIQGCFEDLEGAPLAGVALDFHGWGSNSRTEASQDWKDIEMTSGLDGCFEIAFDPPKGYQFAIDARLSGYAGLGWRWDGFEPGATLDLGTIPLPPESVLSGVVRREDGGELGSGWRVRFESSFSNGGPGADIVYGISAVDPITGAFEVTGIPPGPLDIEAKHRDLGFFPGPDLRVVAGSRVEAEIVVDAPAVDRVLNVHVTCGDFRTFDQLADITVRCVQEADADSRFEKTGRTGHYRFEDLEPSTYRVEVECPAYETWTQGGVQPGDRVVADLVGAAGIRLELTASETGARIPAYSLDVRYPGANFSPNRFEWHGIESPAPEDGVHRGLPAHDALLVVGAPGYAPTEVPLEGIAVGELRPLRIALLPPGSLEVSVVDGEGRPLTGAALALYPDVKGYEPGTYSHTIRFADREALEELSFEGMTDTGGQRLFEGVGIGLFTLRVIAGTRVEYRRGLSILGGERMEVRVELPSLGPLTGRLLGPAGADFADMTIRARPTRLDGDAQGLHRLIRIGAIPSVDVSPNGTFRFEGLAPDDYRLDLHLADFEVPNRSGASYYEGAARPLGTVTVNSEPDSPFEFDISAIYPGWISVDLRHNGSPATAWSVTARGEDSKGGRAVDGGASPDARGETRIGPLFAGRYLLSVNSFEERWIHGVEEAVVVPPNGLASPTIELQTGRGRVRFVSEESGEALGNLRIRVGRAGFSTDAEGWLELELPSGTHEIRGPGPVGPGEEDRPDALLGWGVHGPRTEEVRLRK